MVPVVSGGRPGAGETPETSNGFVRGPKPPPWKGDSTPGTEAPDMEGGPELPGPGNAFVTGSQGGRR